jgi:hypothetical protein
VGFLHAKQRLDVKPVYLLADIPVEDFFTSSAENLL